MYKQTLLSEFLLDFTVEKLYIYTDLISGDYILTTTIKKYKFYEIEYI